MYRRRYKKKCWKRQFCLVFQDFWEPRYVHLCFRRPALLWTGSRVVKFYEPRENWELSSVICVLANLQWNPTLTREEEALIGINSSSVRQTADICSHSSPQFCAIQCYLLCSTSMEMLYESVLILWADSWFQSWASIPGTDSICLPWLCAVKQRKVTIRWYRSHCPCSLIFFQSCQVWSKSL